jgi:hypothetical protein
MEHGNSRGGGMRIANSTTAIVFGCLITDNQALDGNYTYGGGLDIASAQTVVHMNNTVVARNRAEGGNQRGSGIYVIDRATLEMANCTVVDNVGSRGIANYGTGYIDAVNTIDRSNSGASDGMYRYSCTDRPGEGNINVPAGFRQVRNHQYFLDPAGSACIDAGDPNIHDAVFDTHPLYPEQFINTQRSDIGAYGGPHNWIWLPRD